MDSEEPQPGEKPKHWIFSEDGYLDFLEARLGRKLTYDEWEDARAEYSKAINNSEIPDTSK